MRPRHAGLAAILLLVMVVMVAAGGRLVEPDNPQITIDPIMAEDLPAADDTGGEDEQGFPPRPDDAPTGDTQAQPPAPAAEPERTAHSSSGETPLERIAPRAPLSELSLAVPPEPKAPHDLSGEPLYRPVAEAAGVIAVKGRSLTVSGIEVVQPDETCTDEAGESWPCGVRARSAFRSFLRGRAVTCDPPDEEGAVRCRVGGKDIGEWLVENGWTRAAGSGPYEEAAGKAKAARKGIFGAAPNLAGLPPAPPPAEAPPEGQGSILDLSGEAPPAGPATPPAGQPAPFQ